MTTPPEPRTHSASDWFRRGQRPGGGTVYSDPRQEYRKAVLARVGLADADVSTFAVKATPGAVLYAAEDEHMERVAGLDRENQQLRERIAAAMELHTRQKRDGLTVLCVCGEYYPCPTRAALEGRSNDAQH